jgi:hypothetical protein
VHDVFDLCRGDGGRFGLLQLGYKIFKAVVTLVMRFHVELFLRVIPASKMC